MPITVARPKLSWSERIYLPAILSGMAITLKHFKNMLFGRTKVTMQYPEEKWDSQMPEHYRGAPALVRDQTGRVRCVACQLCEFICPPRAIKIVAGEIPASDPFAKVEKFPQEFDIDMIRCIYCGLCEEVCPEQAIFLRKDYAITGTTRAEMVHDKKKLYELGGVFNGNDAYVAERLSEYLGDCLPGLELTERLRAPSRALVEAYARYLGIPADGARQAPVVPAHLFPQWTFPVAARALRQVPYPLARILNAGCRLEINARIPASAPLTVRAQLLSIEDDGHRALLHERVTTDTSETAGALVADLYAVAPTGSPRGRGDRSAPSAAEALRVPFSARELGRLRFGRRAGLAYACLSGDFNPVHWAAAYARAAGFATPILHGFALLAWTIECLGRATMTGGPDRLRFVDVKFKRPLVLGRGIEVGVYRDDAAPGAFYVADAPGVRPYLAGSIGYEAAEELPLPSARPEPGPPEISSAPVADDWKTREARHA